MTDTCFSGGAVGADTAFTNAATAARHRVINYSFNQHESFVPRNTRRLLTETELLSGEASVKSAAKYLRKDWSEYSGKARKLILRNYWQIKDVSSVYAVADIRKDNRVSGGTGWAVTMAIMKNVPDIYVCSNGVWFRWFGTSDPNNGHWGKSNPPRPEGLYAGIGSRDIDENDVKIIWSLYE